MADQETRALATRWWRVRLDGCVDAYVGAEHATAALLACVQAMTGMGFTDDVEEITVKELTADEARAITVNDDEIKDGNLTMLPAGDVVSSEWE